MTEQIMLWGIKASLRDYLADVEAEVTVEEPARRLETGFAFTQGVASESDGGTLLQFQGSVHIFAHGGLMDVLLDTPRLRLQDGSGALEIHAPSESLSIANLTPSQQENQWTATLTSAGAKLFGGNYPSGTLLDPISLSSWH